MLRSYFGGVTVRFRAPPGGNSGTPGVPVGFAGVAGTDTITLSWDPNPPADAVLHYTVSRKTGPGLYSPRPPVTTTTDQITGLAPGDYTFHVTATNAQGDSSPSPDVTVTIAVPPSPPGTPTGFRIAGVTASTITFSWTPSTGTVDHYVLYELHGTRPATDPYVARDDNIGGSPITEGGYGAGETHYFKLAAVGPGGTSPKTAYVAATTHTTGAIIIPPGAIMPDDGSADVTQDIFDYLAAHASDYQRIIFPTDRAGGAPGRVTYWVDGTIVLQHMTNVTIDLGGTNAAHGTDGVLMVQHHTAPYAASGLYVIFTPTGAQIGPFANNALAVAGAKGRNHDRSFFEMRGCTRTHIARGEWRGAYDGTGFNNLYENQNGVALTDGGDDNALGWMHIANIWGNAWAAITPPAVVGGSRPLYKGFWFHDSTVNKFGRQVNTATWGRNFIVERISGGGCDHTWIDSEPVTAEVPDGNRPDATVQDIHIIDCDIGHHGGVWLGLHPGVMNIHANNCTGRGLIVGACVAERVIIENCADHPANANEVNSYPYTFGNEAADAADNHTGRTFGGQMLIVRNNTGVCKPGGAGVHFQASCHDYRAGGNVYTDTNGNPARSVQDDAHNPGTVPSTFTLPIPAHALRDP